MASPETSYSPKVQKRSLRGHKQPVLCISHPNDHVKYSTIPDGQKHHHPSLLLSGSEDGTARLWDLRTRKTAYCIIVPTIENEPNDVTAVAFHPSIIEGSDTMSGEGYTRDCMIYASSGTNVYGYDLRSCTGPIITSPPQQDLSSSFQCLDEINQLSFSFPKNNKRRVVTSVEGDLGQSALAWKLLGGSDERAFTSKLTEVYESNFIAPDEGMTDATYTFEGKEMQSAILDRSFELSSRTGIDKSTIQVDAKNNAIEYTRNNNEGPVNLAVVSRKIEPVTESGFGSDEIYRIFSSAGGIFAGSNVYRCARVRRRFRRGFDESTGKRIIDGIEIVTTHRVLDGVAGIEKPTSTCKTRLRYTQL